MTKEEFDLQIMRLREEYGDKKVSSEKAAIFWSKLNEIDAEDFTEVVDSLISNLGRAPLLSDFTTPLQPQLRALEDREEGELPECTECRSTGTVMVMRAQRIDGELTYQRVGYRCHCKRGSRLCRTIGAVAEPSTYAYHYDFYRCMGKAEVVGENVDYKTRNSLFMRYKNKGKLIFETSMDDLVSEIIAPGEDLTQYGKGDDYKVVGTVWRTFPPQLDATKKLGNTIQIQVPNGFVASLVQRVGGPILLRDIFEEATIGPMGQFLIFDTYTEKPVDKLQNGTHIEFNLKLINSAEETIFPFKVESAKKSTGHITFKKNPIPHNGVTDSVNQTTLFQ